MSKLFCLPSEKVSTLKGKNFLPWEQILSFQSRSLFQKGLVCYKSKQKITEPVSLGKTLQAKNKVYPVPLNDKPNCVQDELNAWQSSVTV